MNSSRVFMFSTDCAYGVCDKKKMELLKICLTALNVKSSYIFSWRVFIFGTLIDGSDSRIKGQCQKYLKSV